jgi:hypothetical protein
MAAEWVGHAVTWWLSAGTSAAGALSGNLHAYLEPVGFLVALVTVSAAAAAWAAARALSRTTWAWQRWLRQGGGPPADRPHLTPSTSVPNGPGSVSFRRAWLALVAAQLGAYLVQENLEAVIAGDRAPHLRALAEHRGLPVVVHAVVALVATAALVAAGRGWIRRRLTARRVIAAYRALIRRRTAGASPPTALIPARPTLRERFGTSLLPRPPPLLHDVASARAARCSVSAGII